MHDLFPQPLLEQIQAGIWMFSEEGVTRYANAALSGMLGATTREVVGTSLLDWVPPEDRSAALAMLKAESRGHDRVFVRRDGQRITARTYVGPYTLEGGEDGVLALVEDVSHRRMTQASAAEHSAHLQRALELSNMAMWEWFPDHVRWSGALQQIFGVPASAFPRSDAEYFQLVHPDDKEQLSTMYWRLLSSHQGQREMRFNYRIVRPSGEVRWVEATGQLDSDALGRPLRGFGTVLDITDRMRFQRAATEVQKHDASLQVAAAAAHEINNMLTAIMVAADTLPGEPEIENSQLILQAAEHAAVLSRSLLEAARAPRSAQGVDLSRFLQQNERVFRGLGHAHITFSADITEGIAVTLDRGSLNQLVVNLILNAMNALGDSGAVHLSLHSERLLAGRHGLQPGRWAVISVRDDGPGMPDDVVARIFEPFFTTRQDGNGMGLAASRAIAERAGGTITVDTAVGVGTTMQIWLPQRAAVDVPHPLSATSGWQPAVRPARILLAEDTTLAREVVAQKLRLLGYEVITARDGLEAMARLQEGMVDLVVTDLYMPRMSGLELCETVNRLHPQLPVIVVSSQERGARAASEGLGVLFLAKPYDIGKLAAAIRASLPG